MLNILLTNDDGLSYGLELLAKQLSKFGLVYVSIPKEQMSAKSHSVSINSIINIQKLKETVTSTEDTILVNGTPADSAKMGIIHYNKNFDLVFSGVNNGLNLAKDVIYSGTVAAAKEAYIFNIPSCAISINSFYSDYFSENLNLFLNYYFENKLYEKAKLINVNLPDNKAVGIKFTNLGQRLHYNQFTLLNDTTYRIDSSFLCYNESIDSDIYNLEQNYITITPLTYDQTDYQALRGLNKIND